MYKNKINIQACNNKYPNINKIMESITIGYKVVLGGQFNLLLPFKKNFLLLRQSHPN